MGKRTYSPRIISPQDIFPSHEEQIKAKIKTNVIAYGLIQSYFDMSYKSVCKTHQQLFQSNQVTNSP